MPSTAVPPGDSGAASTLPARTGHRGVSILRTAALVLVVAAFVWLALTVRLPGAGPAGWLDLDGERIGVVTSDGLPRAAVAKAQRFVEFELIPSRVGLAVLALADDLTVQPGLDGVAIGPEAGLTLSGPCPL